MTKWKESDNCRWCPGKVFRRLCYTHNDDAKYWYTHTFECDKCGKTYLDSSSIVHEIPKIIKKERYGKT